MRLWPIADLAATFRPFGVLALTALISAACTPPTRQAPAARLYAIDQADGAKSCTVSPMQVADGRETPIAMTVGNDGGWCALTLSNSGQPYAAGLLTARPAHGRVYIHTVGSATRIDYTPTAQHAGPDSFTVKMQPGDAVARVAVTVSPK